MITMTALTTQKIKAFAHDEEQANSLLALMNYYKVNNLLEISEQMGLAFLSKLERGEINVEDYLM